MAMPHLESSSAGRRELESDLSSLNLLYVQSPVTGGVGPPSAAGNRFDQDRSLTVNHRGQLPRHADVQPETGYRAPASGRCHRKPRRDRSAERSQATRTGSSKFAVDYSGPYLPKIARVTAASSTSNQMGAAIIRLQFHPRTNMAAAMAETLSYVNRAHGLCRLTVPPCVMRFDGGSVASVMSKLGKERLRAQSR
jgi:hypothetical protein